MVQNLIVWKRVYKSRFGTHCVKKEKLLSSKVERFLLCPHFFFKSSSLHDAKVIAREVNELPCFQYLKPDSHYNNNYKNTSLLRLYKLKFVSISLNVSSHQFLFSRHGHGLGSHTLDLLRFLDQSTEGAAKPHDQIT